jgi:diguanylate cyclase
MSLLGNGSGAESIEFLRRALIKVSLAGNGVHERLDVALNALRKTLREGQELDAVQADVERITDLLRTLGDEASKRAQTQISLPELLDALLAGKLPDPVRRGLLELQSSPPESASELAGSIIKAFRQWPDAQPFFNRLWGRPMVAGSSPGSGVSDASTAAAPDIVLATVVEPLLRVIDNLRLPENHRHALGRVRARLEKLDQLADLPEAISALAETLLDASQVEHAQFEQFLTQLNGRLGKVQQFLENSSFIIKDSRDDTDELQTDMQVQMRALRQSVSEARDLGELQAGIEQRIEGILSRIDSYREKQRQRLDAREQDFSQLKQQLRATEDEAARLRENLSEQRQRANTDALTAMPNRHAYNDRLTAEYNRWRRYRHHLSMAIGDIDRFKRINDTHGHMAGDAVLKAVAKILCEGLRESDFIARYGGEEFVILMPETPLVDATKAVNKLRLALAAQPIAIGGETALNVTISFGVAEFESDDVPRDVYTRADTALYRAKTKGRNLVACERRKVSEPGAAPDKLNPA